MEKRLASQVNPKAKRTDKGSNSHTLIKGIASAPAPLAVMTKASFKVFSM